MRRAFWSATPIMAIAMASGCKPSYSTNAVQTAISPDKQIEAVVLETNGGATTSFGYKVELQKIGDNTSTEVAVLYGAQRNEAAFGVNLRWTAPNALHVEYLKAKKIVQLGPAATIDGHVISIKLDEGIIDPSATAGAMMHGASTSR